MSKERGRFADTEGKVVYAVAAVVLAASVAFALFGIHGHWTGCPLVIRVVCDPQGYGFELGLRGLVVLFGAAVAGLLTYLGSRIGAPRWPRDE